MARAQLQIDHGAPPTTRQATAALAIDLLVATAATARGAPVALPHPADDEHQERGSSDQVPASAGPKHRLDRG